MNPQMRHNPKDFPLEVGYDVSLASGINEVSVRGGQTKWDSKEKL